MLVYELSDDIKHFSQTFFEHGYLTQYYMGSFHIFNMYSWDIDAGMSASNFGFRS